MAKTPAKAPKKKVSAQAGNKGSGDIKATISKAISSKNLKSLKVKFK